MTPAVPRPAATVLLLRDGSRGLQVFMVVRHHRIDFASGALVFPGGRVEADDRALADSGYCAGPEGLDADGMALRVAGIREAFEECGVLLARPRGGTGLLDAARLASTKPDDDFRALLETHNLELATELLTPFAHWITPPALAKRFDTHFFLTPAPADQLAVHDGNELVESVWIEPARAVAEAAEGRWKAGVPHPSQSDQAGALEHGGGGDRGGPHRPDRDRAAARDPHRGGAANADPARRRLWRRGVRDE